MPRTVTIRSLPMAFAVIKEMQGQDCDWGEDYRAAGRAALAEILEGQIGLARGSAPGGDGRARGGRPPPRPRS